MITMRISLGLFFTLLVAALPAQAQSFSKGLLWKIEKPGASPSYVLGTMHSEDERVTNLPSQVKQALGLICQC